MRRVEIRMELTEALVMEDITPFERERLREALEDEVRRQLPTDRRLTRVVDWDPGCGHAVENAPGMSRRRFPVPVHSRDEADRSSEAPVSVSFPMSCRGSACGVRRIRVAQGKWRCQMCRGIFGDVRSTQENS
jgi:hypothetical protein